MKQDNFQNTGDKLQAAITDYLLWMIDKGYAQTTWSLYERVLRCFLEFIRGRSISWKLIFTAATMSAFRNEYNRTHIQTVLRGLSRYLFKQKRIPRPLDERPGKLPEIYEQYLLYYQRTRGVHPQQLQRARRVLISFSGWLKKRKIKPTALRIEQIDQFLAEYNGCFATETRQNHRSVLRGFLRYLYYEQKAISRDLAALVVGAPVYANARPPRFLRPEELRRLFRLRPETPTDFRAYAMVHLAYFLGLRPKEISLISLDDIAFTRGEIKLPDRKSSNPMTLPLAEQTIKALAAYIVGAREETDKRTLFLCIRAPYNPVTPAHVSHDIQAWMRKARLTSSAYWLRHTYAQNLLEADASIFEIKEMLGHDRIQTANRYIHIHTSMMREVLFDETL